MSNEFYDELEGLIGKHRQADEQKAKDEANEERFSRIEKGLEGIGKLIDERLPKGSPQQSNSEDSRGDRGEESSPASEEPPPENSEEELPVERVGKFNVPKIYTGEDEPDIVEYIDADTGDKMTRKGRKKNRPTTVDVRPVEAEANEPENVPQEPDEANA